jgi:asparagine synthase (glutamine-hydrolysing)
MCGINFILDKKKQLNATYIEAMNRAIVYRGKDGSYEYVHQAENCQVFFGHNRLKIIDVSKEANQPFFSFDKRYILIYNGEIYNFKEIRKNLSSKYTFRTHSDTEVLLYYLIENGINNIHQDLNGIYAFVLYDTITQEISIGRDRFGIKPLYKYEDESYLIYSSEIKGILASSLVKKELNHQQIFHYLQFKYAQSPQTFFKNIEEVKTTDHRPQITDHRPQAINKHLSVLDDSLKTAVQRQLAADIPVGMFLSGGVDSTLLLAYLQELGIEKTPSFTIVNDSKEANFGTKDYHYAGLAAKQYHAEQSEVAVKDNVLNGLSDFVKQLEQPIADTAYWLTQLLAQEASTQKINVILSGAGADELFAGYHRHQAFYYYRKYYSLFKLCAPLLRNIQFLFPAGFSHPFRKRFRLLQKLSSQLSPSPTQTWRKFTTLNLSPNLFLDGENNIQFEIKDIDLLSYNFLLLDQQHYLQADVLALTDRAGMRHSVEVRVPYLDNEIVDLAHQFSPQYLLKKGRKWLLAELLSQKGGRVYTQRSKEGFGIPFGQWIRYPQHQYWVDYLQRTDLMLYQYISASVVKSMLQQHLQQKQDFTSEIWAILLLAIWLEEHFG